MTEAVTVSHNQRRPADDAAARVPRRFLALVYLVAPPSRCLTGLPGRCARWRSPMRCDKSALRGAPAGCESSWTTHPSRSQSATKSPRSVSRSGISPVCWSIAANGYVSFGLSMILTWRIAARERTNRQMVPIWRSIGRRGLTGGPDQGRQSVPNVTPSPQRSVVPSHQHGCPTVAP